MQQFLRSPDQDKRKSAAQLKEQITRKIICSIDGCGEPLSMFTGPGGNQLCRKHQLQQREYGGPGRLDRPWTFHREGGICSHCGKNVIEEVNSKYPGLVDRDPVLFNKLWRNRIIADHIIRKADGGDHSKKNIQPLCLDCEADKTILGEDYMRSKINK